MTVVIVQAFENIFNFKTVMKPLNTTSNNIQYWYHWLNQVSIMSFKTAKVDSPVKTTCSIVNFLELDPFQNDDYQHGKDKDLHHDCMWCFARFGTISTI